MIARVERVRALPFFGCPGRVSVALPRNSRPGSRASVKASAACAGGAVVRGCARAARVAPTTLACRAREVAPARCS